MVVWFPKKTKLLLHQWILGLRLIPSHCFQAFLYAIDAEHAYLWTVEKKANKLNGTTGSSVCDTTRAVASSSHLIPFFPLFLAFDTGCVNLMIKNQLKIKSSKSVN